MRVFLFISFLVISTSLLANNNGGKEEALKTFTISGKVTDNHEGLTGVQVLIDGKETLVYTDFDGNFTLENVVEGNHVVSFNMVTYEHKSVEVNTNSNNIVVEMSGR